MIKLQGKRILFIDPGLVGTGWAFFPECWVPLSALPMPEKGYRPTAWGVLKSNQTDWQDKAHQIAGAFDDILFAQSVGMVGIEFPQVWKHSLRSQASSDSGDLFKLTYLIGLLAGLSAKYTDIKPTIFHPMDWKGQLPKEVVLRRLLKLCGTKFNNHVADAVGMGYAAQGLLEQKRG